MEHLKKPCANPELFFQWFNNQVQKHPHKIALRSLKEKLTYQELDELSNCLAYHILEKTSESNAVIGLCLPLDTFFIVGILGILKAGCVYLPLDPKYPQDRLNHMVDDAKPSIIITTKSNNVLFKHQNFINLDEDSENIFSHKGSLPFSSFCSLNHLAYIIYTSGSTGKPKGIAIARKSLSHIATAHRDFYPQDIRALVSGGVCFDVSILIIFHTLIHGGTLYLFEEILTSPIEYLIQWIERHQINFMICVPSVYRLLLEQGKPLPSLESVSLTGENLPTSLSLLHQQFAPNAFLYNEYGPSECAIGAMIAKVYDPKIKKLHRVSIGFPLPNTYVQLLDDHLNPVPLGTKGEIYIGGVGLALGYLNRLELTQERFIWHVLPTGEQIRLYKTGDIGRLLPNGEMEFLGRIEQMTQLNEDCIHIGEIEHAICLYPEVKEAVVMLLENPLSKAMNPLTVFIKPVNSELNLSQLNHHLQAILPKNMIPSKVIQVEKFPLSPNGKIDRAALIQ